MKIAELFVVLGFKIEGGDTLPTTERELSKLESTGRKAALRVGALTAGFLLMMQTSMKAAVALRNFALTTGLSTDELQQWHEIAMANGVSAETMTQAILNLQDAASEFKLGNGESMGLWSMLGVDPRQDPFKVLDALRKRLLGGFDVGLMRNLLGKIGMEGIMPVLRSTDTDFEKWSKAFIVTKKETDQLVKLNAEWQKLKLGLEGVKTQFSAILAPAFALIAKALTWVTEQLAIFNHWLEQGTPAANFLKTALQVLIPLLMAVGTAMVAAFAAGPFLAVLTPVGELVGGLLIMVALLDDIWTSLNGGKAVTREIGEWLAQFQLIYDVIERIWAIWDKVVKPLNLLSDGYQQRMRAAGDATSTGRWFPAMNQKTENKIMLDIKIAQALNGGGIDATQVGSYIVDALKDHYRSASSQSPQDDL